MPSFTGEGTTDRPRRFLQGTSSPSTARDRYSLFPHPAAFMFAANPDQADEQTNSSSADRGPRRISKMSEEEEDGAAADKQGPAFDRRSSGTLDGPRVEFHQEATQERTTLSSSMNRSTGEAFNRPGRGKGGTSSLRSQLKTIQSGRSLTSFGSPSGRKNDVPGESSDLPRHQGAGITQSTTTMAVPSVTRPASMATEHSDKYGASNLGDGVSGPSITSKMRRLLPRTIGTSSPVKAASMPSVPSIPSQSQVPTPRTSSDNTNLRTIRRYQINETVLVSNHKSRKALLVNRFGFPPGEGKQAEEQRGPYLYMLATVEKIHYDEYEVYYTIRRADNGMKQRADAMFMEPILSEMGEIAAQRAATRSVLDQAGQRIEESVDHHSEIETRDRSGSILRVFCSVVLIPLHPLLFLVRTIGRTIRPVSSSILTFVRKRAVLILNGESPYACQIRWTAVNFIVICATWYMFIDQARLAFFPPRSDRAVAIVNLVVWIILVLELCFQAFIRPDGYKFLVISDKAYTPGVVKYINSAHLIVEICLLLLFIPEFLCILSSSDSCGNRYPFSFQNATLLAITSPTALETFYGRAFLAVIRLRVFILVRHWKTMWVNSMSLQTPRRSRLFGSLFPSKLSTKKVEDGKLDSIQPDMQSTNGRVSVEGELHTADENLTNASAIGTALLVTNSYRALATIWVVLGLFPLLYTILRQFSNPSAEDMTEQLQVSYRFLLANTSGTTEVCNYWNDTVISWINAMAAPDVHDDWMDPFLLSLQVEPNECYGTSDVLPVFVCAHGNGTGSTTSFSYDSLCSSNATTIDEIASALNLRRGSIVEYTSSQGPVTVRSLFDQTYTVEIAARASCLLQFCMLVTILGGLSVMRHDAEALVLGPLRRMLKIVAQYARNPLSQPKFRRGYRGGRRKYRERDDFDDETLSDSSSEGSYDDNGALTTLGSYETEQLITAVTVITDLLRKCWGVAGADIISTNLASTDGALTQVFNPTVPGKSVYALFGFAAINGFDHAMRSLGDDLIDLINNVANVLHSEVFRWGFGDSGQCNKNLGSAFLMVFRIGLVKEVIQKLEQAQDVIFSGSKAAHNAVRRRVRHSQTGSGEFDSFLNGSSSLSMKLPGTSSKTTSGIVRSSDQTKRKHTRHSRNKAMGLNLASLPGISTFTDRAVIGMLKSFACIYRDKDIQKWNKDFRLGAGVGAFSVSVFYGMDAGWAVEGAVGSQYKIDATYLSPHVNMASRMMSACKQYRVSILLSQAVQELMSDTGRSKLRHVDTVTVKGSSVKQRIYTYDARNKGVHFFLLGRSDEQADLDAERFSPNIWNTDPDLTAMRQHITDDFLAEFNKGQKAYISGDWPVAIKRLNRANEIMIEAAVEQGYLEDEFDAIQMQDGEDAHAAAEELKRENGDGPSLFLINYMQSHGGVAPRKWEGWHPLNRK